MFYRVARAFLAVLVRLVFRLEYVNRERLNDVKGKIICANHTSYWDPVLVAAATHGSIRFMGKIELFDVPVLGHVVRWLRVFPVKRGGNDVGAIKTAFSILKNNETLGIFPEGTRNTDGTDGAKAGVVTIATRADCAIVPISITAPIKLFSKMRVVVGEDVYYNKEEWGRAGTEEHRKIAEKIMTYIGELSRDEHASYTG